jgi:hypothetical protein
VNPEDLRDTQSHELISAEEWDEYVPSEEKAK